MLALIDADTIIFRAAVNHETCTWFGDGLPKADPKDPGWVYHRDTEGARKAIRKGILKIAREVSLVYPEIVKTVPVVSAFEGNFRKDIVTTYKAFRRKTASAKTPQSVRQVCSVEFRRALSEWTINEAFDDGLSVPRLEADDVISLIATAPGQEHLVVSIDKDLDTIPGHHYNPDKGMFYEITKSHAMRRFYEQALSGDPTDGFGGCPRVGPKTAYKVVSEHWPDEVATWQAIVERYAAKGLDEDYAVSQARMAWLLVDGDYDYEKQEVTLWVPPTGSQNE